jgi:death-on-curing protein
MEMWGESRFGIEDRPLIESALARPRHAAVYENADLVRQASTLCFGLIKNHPWTGGNKRTATFLMDYFLKLNGQRLTALPREVYQMTLDVESDRWFVDEIEDWLRIRVEDYSE